METKDTILEALDIEILETLPDRVVCTMPVGPKTRQPMGMLHGGASVVLAETAASIGTWIQIDQENEIAAGMEINANHLRPVKDGRVTAVAVPVHRGRSTMVWEIRITDERGRLVCISRCTVAIVKK
jgi:1,4-dihydroxy-2-naphthoyl-CoA hydrolase